MDPITRDLSTADRKRPLTAYQGALDRCGLGGTRTSARSSALCADDPFTGAGAFSSTLAERLTLQQNVHAWAR